MSRLFCFALFYLAIFLQAGAYGLTFMLPRLFEAFGADEKAVGLFLSVTAIATLLTVYYSGHLCDWFGRVRMLGFACLAIALAMALYGQTGTGAGAGVEIGAGDITHAPILILTLASLLLGFGWGLTYALGPIVMARLVSAEERIRSFTLLSIAVMAGFGLSPVLAAFLERRGFAVNDAFSLTGLLCVLSGILFFLLVAPIRAHAITPGPEAKSSLTVEALFRIFASPARLPVVMVFIGASVFAGMTNFQTVFADARGLNYADYFLIYTITVVAFRIVLARFKGGGNPYLTISLLQYVMFGAVILFIFISGEQFLYWLVAFLFGLGYGVSYPILVAMTASDAKKELMAQTLQLFALTYFIGIFGFPLIAGWLIVEWSAQTLLILTASLAFFEASLALRRAICRKAQNRL